MPGNSRGPCMQEGTCRNRPPPRLSPPGPRAGRSPRRAEREPGRSPEPRR
ncbi:MAG: hypothetical protein MZU79_00460 [Anaerotruncus sp.]|nr:hypothetical protein [Anaerotruncus sp.]